jgi:hypothetical protein
VTCGGDSGNRIFVLYWRCPLIRVSVIGGSTVYVFSPNSLLLPQFLSRSIWRPKQLTPFNRLAAARPYYRLHVGGNMKVGTFCCHLTTDTETCFKISVSLKVPTGSGAHPASYSTDIMHILAVKCWGVKVDIRLHLVLRLRMGGSIPPLPSFFFTA